LSLRPVFPFLQAFFLFRDFLGECRNVLFRVDTGRSYLAPSFSRYDEKAQNFLGPLRTLWSKLSFSFACAAFFCSPPLHLFSASTQASGVPLLFSSPSPPGKILWLNAFHIFSSSQLPCMHHLVILFFTPPFFSPPLSAWSPSTYFPLPPFQIALVRSSWWSFGRGGSLHKRIYLKECIFFPSLYRCHSFFLLIFLLLRLFFFSPKKCSRYLCSFIACVNRCDFCNLPIAVCRRPHLPFPTLGFSYFVKLSQFGTPPPTPREFCPTGCRAIPRLIAPAIVSLIGPRIWKHPFRNRVFFSFFFFFPHAVDCPDDLAFFLMPQPGRHFFFHSTSGPMPISAALRTPPLSFFRLYFERFPLLLSL